QQRRRRRRGTGRDEPDGGAERGVRGALRRRVPGGEAAERGAGHWDGRRGGYGHGHGGRCRAERLGEGDHQREPAQLWQVLQEGLWRARGEVREAGRERRRRGGGALTGWLLAEHMPIRSWRLA